MNKNVKKIIRVTLLIIALINVGLDLAGYPVIDLDSQTVTTFINEGFVVAMALWNTWKNFSVTQPHLKADEIAEHIKQGAEIVIQYKTGGEHDYGSNADHHEVDDPEDAEEEDDDDEPGVV